MAMLNDVGQESRWIESKTMKGLLSKPGKWKILDEGREQI